VKEALQIAYQLLAAFSKKTLAVMIIAIPLASYAFATMYVKHKFEVANTQSLIDRFNKLDSLVTELQNAQQLSVETIMLRIELSELNNTRQVNFVERRIVNEFTSQLKFVVQYQNQSTNMLIDHLDNWRISYLSALKDSLSIKATKVKRP
jgi:hypothetical protein